MPESELQTTTVQQLKALLHQHKLPDHYLDAVTNYFYPITQQLQDRIQHQGQTILGIQGSQGSGKSTMAVFMQALFEYEFNIKSSIVSLDDFYIDRAQRQALAKRVHPLLVTRGVPGTHDVELMKQVFDNFLAGRALTLPRFDKSRDNPSPKNQWLHLKSPPPLLIFEGWCVGIGTQAESELAQPVNELESKEDFDGAWRQFVNDAIKEHYQNIYDKLDTLVVLQAPSFACVHEWRSKQEAKLRARLRESGAELGATMSKPELLRFIQHYQRLTEHGLHSLPGSADYLLPLHEDHTITGLQSA